MSLDKLRAAVSASRDGVRWRWRACVPNVLGDVEAEGLSPTALEAMEAADAALAAVLDARR